MTLRLILAAALVLVSPVARSTAASATPAPEGVAFFEQKIRPVLLSACYECHSAEAKAKGKLKGGLFLDTRTALLTGGDEGPAIIPGKADDSLLLKALRWAREDLHMPPKSKLPPEVIADFEKWVAMGAPDPRTGEVAKARREISIPQGRDYWAFRSLRPVPVPTVKNASWAKTPIDRFILARQEAAKVTPSKPIGREQLLRRATFDLTGLPPTPEQLAAFERDFSLSHSPTFTPAGGAGGKVSRRESESTALTRVVDQLLASPAYGERWGRHWLDIVRYAESNGYEFDAFRPGAFHYRDWVIRALNDGMPYDRFIRWQLAGDKLLPDTIEGASATGFLVAGPYPGQITAKTVERIRYDQLDDMVSTIGSGFLGLTLGCVRCHEHKYDPIPQTDYYGIAAALARTVHGELKIDRQHEETQRKLAAHKLAGEPFHAALKQFEAEQFPARFAKFLASDAATATTNPAPWQMTEPLSATAQTAFLDLGSNGVVRYTGNKAKDDTYTVKAQTYQRGLRAFRLDAFADAALPAKGPGLSDNGNFVLGDFKVIARPLDAKSKAKPVTLKLKAVAATFEQKNYNLSEAVDNNPNSGWAVAPQFGKDHAAIFGIEGEPVGFEGGTELEFQLKFSNFFGIGRLRLGFSTNATNVALTEPKHDQHLTELRAALAATGGELNATNRAALFRWFTKFDPDAQRVLAAVQEHAAKTPKPDLVPVYSTRAGGQDVHLLRRGEVDSKISKADPNYLQVLNTAAEGAKRWLPKPEADPRVALGEWLTDAEHGAGSLLARVMVNRVWQHHFGRGLVATPNDFGVQGKPPTHPELLDWLAGEPVEQLGMRRGLALHAKVIRRRDEAAPEVMLPDAVHHHAREQASRAVLGVGEPLAQRHARVGLGLGEPAFRALGRGVEHLEIIRVGLGNFAVHLAAPEQVNVLPTGPRGIDGHEVGLRRLRRVLLHGGQHALRVGIELGEPAEQRRAVRRVQLTARRGQRGAQLGEMLVVLRLGERDVRGVGAEAQPQPADAEEVAELELELQLGPALEAHRLALDAEDRRVVLAELRRDGPPGVRVVVHGLAEVVVLLLERGGHGLELERDGLGLGLRVERARDDLEIAEDEVAVVREAGAFGRQRGIRERIEPERAQPALVGLRLHGVGVVLRLVAGVAHDAVGAEVEERSLCRGAQWLGHLPRRGIGRCGCGVAGKELREARGELLGLELLQCRMERFARQLVRRELALRFLVLPVNLQLAMHRARERGGDAVVVGLRNRVILVLVAAHTAEREAEEAAADGRDHVVELVVADALDGLCRDLPRIGTGDEKARGARTLNRVRQELVARELPADEAVIRHPVVERADDPVAVVKRAGAEGIELVTVALGVAHDVQPVASPALAVGGGGEQLVHDAREGGALTFPPAHFPACPASRCESGRVRK